jgi:hypothetical protein
VANVSSKIESLKTRIEEMRSQEIRDETGKTVTIGEMAQRSRSQLVVDDVASALISTALAMRQKWNESARPRLEAFNRNYPTIKTLEDLKILLESMSERDFCQKVLKMRTKKARGILQKLGFTVVQSEQASMRVFGPHLKQSDLEQEILRILAVEQRPLTRKEITNKLHEKMHTRFSDADVARIKTGGERWKKNARWGITTLKRNQLIESKEKNQYTLTAKGRESLKS